MMELSLKSKSIKKKSKKKKNRIAETVIKPLIKPGTIDGVCNWVQMQKIIGPVKEKMSKTLTGTEEDILKIVGIRLNSKDYKPPFNRNISSKKKSNHGSREKCIQVNAKSGHINDGDKDLKEKPPVESEQSDHSRKNQSQPHKFCFTNSDNLSPNKNYNHEGSRNRFGEKKLTKAVAMDCEMVGTGPKGEESIIARVSIVNTFGVCLYDEFVKPIVAVTDFRTKISGVRPSDLKEGKDLFEVQKDVSKIIEGRILVGHSVKHDLDVLFISHPRHLIRDTAFYKPFRAFCGGKTPSLKNLASKILGCEIQAGEHSSVEDAHATMLLYLRQREEWEAQVEDAQAAMLLYLRMKKEWEKEVKSHRKRKPKNIENLTKS